MSVEQYNTHDQIELRQIVDELYAKYDALAFTSLARFLSRHDDDEVEDDKAIT